MNDGTWRLKDGREWETKLTIQDNLVVRVDGLWRDELEGLTFEAVKVKAEKQKLQLEQID